MKKGCSIHDDEPNDDGSRPCPYGRGILGALGREFTNGDALQGSEKLWGAASHAAMAIAMQRGWSFSKHNAKVAAVNRLAQEYDERSLALEFLTAEQFHASFYHDFMEDDVIERGRPVIAHFVRRIIEIVEAGSTTRSNQ